MPLSATYALMGLLIAVAASATLDGDRRFEGVDWKVAWEQLRYYVDARAGAWLDPDDIVQAVLTKALRTDIAQWKPDEQPIHRYLLNLANTEISNVRTSRYHRKEREELSDVVHRTTGSPGADAEAKLSKAYLERRHERVVGELRRFLVKDALPLFLLDVYEAGMEKHDESTTRALEAGYSMSAITAARQKIHRVMAKVLDEDAQEDARLLRVGAR
jgi:hypothetical protein